MIDAVFNWMVRVVASITDVVFVTGGKCFFIVLCVAIVFALALLVGTVFLSVVALFIKPLRPVLCWLGTHSEIVRYNMVGHNKWACRWCHTEGYIKNNSTFIPDNT